MRHLWPALLAAGLITGCSSGTDNASTESSSSTTETVSAPEVCQQVADEAPSGGYPASSKWSALVSTLDGIEAPDELSTPLSDLRQAAQVLADDPTSTDLLDARSDMRDALDSLNEECKAAGSNALQ